MSGIVVVKGVYAFVYRSELGIYIFFMVFVMNLFELCIVLFKCRILFLIIDLIVSLIFASEIIALHNFCISFILLLLLCSSFFFLHTCVSRNKVLTDLNYVKRREYAFRDADLCGGYVCPS